MDASLDHSYRKVIRVKQLERLDDPDSVVNRSSLRSKSSLLSQGGAAAMQNEWSGRCWCTGRARIATAIPGPFKRGGEYAQPEKSRHDAT
jgi:hypothetical protein